MTMQQIMTRAHQIARSCEGNYSARLALGLQQAWVEARLLKNGKRWTKGTMDRIYFNDLPRWYGLQLDHYKTGNIASATLDGENISNSQARKIAGRLALAKVWYDVTTAKFQGQNIDGADFGCIVESLQAA